MRIREIMSEPVVTAPPDMTAAEARAAMKRSGIRHLAVTTGRRIEGVVCAHDLRLADPGSTIADVMSAPAATLPPDADVPEVARLLRRHDVGSVLVVEDGRLKGIVTTSDLLSLLGKGAIHIQPMAAKWTMPRRGPRHPARP
jgi:CBS domain-containing protein